MNNGIIISVIINVKKLDEHTLSPFSAVTYHVLLFHGSASQSAGTTTVWTRTQKTCCQPESRCIKKNIFKSKLQKEINNLFSIRSVLTLTHLQKYRCTKVFVRTLRFFDTSVCIPGGENPIWLYLASVSFYLPPIWLCQESCMIMKLREVKTKV